MNRLSYDNISSIVLEEVRNKQTNTPTYYYLDAKEINFMSIFEFWKLNVENIQCLTKFLNLHSNKASSILSKKDEVSIVGYFNIKYFHVKKISAKNCKDVLLTIVEGTMWVTWDATTNQEDELQIFHINLMRNYIKINHMLTYTLWVTRKKVVIKRYLKEIRDKDYKWLERLKLFSIEYEYRKYHLLFLQETQYTQALRIKQEIDRDNRSSVSSNVSKTQVYLISINKKLARKLESYIIYHRMTTTSFNMTKNAVTMYISNMKGKNSDTTSKNSEPILYAKTQTINRIESNNKLQITYENLLKNGRFINITYKYFLSTTIYKYILQDKEERDTQDWLKQNYVDLTDKENKDIEMDLSNNELNDTVVESMIFDNEYKKVFQDDCVEDMEEAKEDKYKKVFEEKYGEKPIIDFVDKDKDKITNFKADNKDKKPTLNEETISKAEKRRRLKERKKNDREKKAQAEREHQRRTLEIIRKKERLEKNNRPIDEDTDMETDEDSTEESVERKKVNNKKKDFEKSKRETKEKDSEKDTEKEREKDTEKEREKDTEKNQDKDKRDGQDHENGRPFKRNKTTAQYLPERMTYREAAQAYTIVEIRSNDGTKLQQGDYNHIADKFTDLLLDVKRVKGDWCVGPSGLSMGAVWYACETRETISCIKLMTPKLEAPEGKKYSYLAFGPGEQPYIYPRLRLPAMWAKKTSEELEARLRRCNELLDQEITMPDNTVRKRVFKVQGKAKDGRDKWNDDGELLGMFSVTLQMDEALLDELIAMQGILQIGPHKCFIEGKEGDRLVEIIENKKAEYEAKIDEETRQREEREANTREGLRDLMLRDKGGDAETDVTINILK